MYMLFCSEDQRQPFGYRHTKRLRSVHELGSRRGSGARKRKQHGQPDRYGRHQRQQCDHDRSIGKADLTTPSFSPFSSLHSQIEQPQFNRSSYLYSFISK